MKIHKDIKMLLRSTNGSVICRRLSYLGDLVSYLKPVCNNTTTRYAEMFLLTHNGRWILASKDMDHYFYAGGNGR